MFPENFGVERFSGRIVSFRPLCLPVRVTQDSPPLLNGEWQEVTPAPFLECAAEEEEMVIENALVLLITTPKEMNRGEGEPSSRCRGKEIDVVDMAHGGHPDLLNFWEPSRCLPNIGETSELRVIRG